MLYVSVKHLRCIAQSSSQCLPKSLRVFSKMSALIFLESLPELCQCTKCRKRFDFSIVSWNFSPGREEKVTPCYKHIHFGDILHLFVWRAFEMTSQLLIFLTVVSLTAISQLISSLRLCLWTRTAIMSLTGGMAEILQLSSVLCLQLAHPKDASSESLVP